jgi:predicted RNA binding protein YcfA (HicA-like mRNA interferase family)
MPRLPRISGDEAIRTLERMGFVAVRQRGDHVVMKKRTPRGSVGCVVPRHDELEVGTLSGVLRQAQVSPEEFIAKLK